MVEYNDLLDCTLASALDLMGARSLKAPALDLMMPRGLDALLLQESPHRLAMPTYLCVSVIRAAVKHLLLRFNTFNCVVHVLVSSAAFVIFLNGCKFIAVGMNET